MQTPPNAGRKASAKPRSVGRIRKDLRKMAKDILNGLPPDQRMVDILLGRQENKGE